MNRSLLLCLLALGLLLNTGCASEGDSPQETSKVLASPPEGAVPNDSSEALAREAFTWASSLNLRRTSDPGSGILQKLAINAPVTVLETGSAMTRVRLRNGTVGWVGSEYIGNLQLTLREIEKQVEDAAGVPKDIISWRQRAVALAPRNLEALKALVRAYIENGEDGKAIPLVKAHRLSVNMTLVATFDGCQQSDTQGVLHNFVDNEGPTGGFADTNWHSFWSSDGLSEFCDYDVADETKMGKKFKLFTTVVLATMCGGPECREEEQYETVRLDVRSVQPLP